MTTKAIYNPKYRALVEFIRAVRKDSGMTQKELGRRMRISHQTVHKIESCEVRLDLVRYVTLCRILGLKAGQLLGRLEEPSDEDAPLYLSELYIRQENKRSLAATFMATCRDKSCFKIESFRRRARGHGVSALLATYQLRSTIKIGILAQQPQQAKGQNEVFNWPFGSHFVTLVSSFWSFLALFEKFPNCLTLL
jgi:transcriptional regulator with XRE-family HTH domain